ncbi:hypothetical protein ACHAXH_007615 [Discostella pseudostelligera]|jgi:hypothetical protein
MKILSLNFVSASTIALIVIMMLVGTCPFAAAAAAAPYGDEDVGGGDGRVSSSSRQIHLLLRGGGGDSSGTMPKQEQQQHPFTITLQNSDGETSAATPCTHSCANGSTCTPGSDRCNRILIYVCGCNGITYSNTCEAFKVGVNVAHSGACVAEDGMMITGRETVSSF